MKTKQKHLFVSPHLDDAVFSAGGYISKLVDANENVIVVNVFTNASSKPYTLSGKKYLQSCGYRNAKKLYRTRVQEDIVALKALGVSIINLSYVDALWRKRVKPLVRGIGEFENVYPTYRFHIQRGRINDQDNKLIESLESELRKIIARNNVTHVYAPIGIGNHVDHLIVNRAVNNIGVTKTYYWEDYPYNLSAKGSSDIAFEFKPDWNEKLEIMKKYKTQFNAVFPNGVVERNERFI